MNVPKIVQRIPFSGTVKNYSNIISCSESYEIAFCTLESLQILEPLVFSFSIDGCSPVAIHRDVIMPSESACQFDFGLDRTTLHMTLTKDELFEFMLDRTLSPVNGCSQSYKGYGEAAWSPLGIGSFGTCALAALTLDHRLTIYVKGSKNWVEIVEPSSVFYEYIKANNYDMPWITSTCSRQFKSIQFQDLYSKSYATAAVKIKWSHMLGKANTSNSTLGISKEDRDSFALLIVGMKNGCIVLWKVKSPIRTSGDLMLATVFDANLGTISSLHWVELDMNSGYLFIGGKMGQICLYHVNAKMVEAVSATYVTSLWSEADKLEVSHISSIKATADSCYIVAGKSNFVMAWELSGKTILGQTHAMGNFVQPLTGLFAEKDTFVCSSGDGTLNRIGIRKENSGLCISFNEILKNIQDKNLAIAGLCCSPNKALFCVVQNISCFYDHLAIREPLTLLFIKQKSMEEIVSEMSVLTDSGMSFSYFNDILHYICYCWLEQKQLPDAFMSLLELSDIQCGMKTTSKLQLARWLLRLAISGEQDEEKTFRYKSEMDIINSVLTRNQLMHLLSKVEHENFITTLDPEDRWVQIVLLVCQWIKDNYGALNEPENDLVDKVYRQATSASGTLTFTVYEETCRLCQQPIPLENILFGKCSNGHAFGRCCLSLMLCDRPTYKKCTNCTVLASTDACDFLQNARCPFCSRIF